MNNARLQYLFEQYIRQTATPEQRAEFERLLQQPGNEAEIKRLLDEVIHANTEDRSRSEASSNSILQNIFLTGISRRLPATIPINRGRNTYQKWMVAAAILIVILGAGAWFLHSAKPGRQNALASLPAARPAAGIHPGTNGAVLTLADGSAITLDSAANGDLATQGNTRLVKRGGGQLVYETGSPGKEVLYNTLTTARGKQYSVTLPDGTKVWLDAASRLYYPTTFTGGERKIELAGQAYFEVAHDSRRPFRVRVGKMEVQVLGTQFNVNAYEDESVTRTTLLEGRIKVTCGGDSAFVSPGQEAQTVGNTGNTGTGNIGNTGVRVIDGVDTDLATAWKNGYTAFKSAGLKTIMRQISRWYDVDILYRGDIGERTFTGEISRNSDLSKLLQILSASGIHFEIEGRRLTVMP